MRRLSLLLAALCLPAVLGGCTMVDKAELQQLRADRKAALNKADALAERNKAVQAELDVRDKQIRMLQALGPKRMKMLFPVVRIELGRYSGGVDLDNKPGDDGIRVYLRPIDADGSVIKAAGDVKIQLFDLAAKPKQNLIGAYEWKVDKIGGHWASGFLSYHYSLTCPWKSAPPKHNEITIRLEFTDYLTGRTFSAQKIVKVTLPPK